MTEAASTESARTLSTLARIKPRWGYLAVAGLLLLFLLPVWWWPLVASQDGPSHLYNASVLSESMSGHGPSTSVYKVSWRPVPNWGGPLLLVGLLKVVPPLLVPRLVLSITAVLSVLATLLVRRQAAGSQGLLWATAIAGCLGTGRAWVMGFESFSIGTAAAIATIACYERFRHRLGPIQAISVAALLTLTYFCHLVPCVFAGGVIAVLALLGPAVGRSRRLWWTAAIVLTAVPWFLIYRRLSAEHGGGLELDWSHLRGFRPTGVRSWLMLVARADCVSVMNHLLPFTGIGFANAGPAEAHSATHLVKEALIRILLNPFALLTAALLLQAFGTLVVEIRARDFRRTGWFLLGFGGILAALFIPDGTPQNGTFLPFRVMLLALTLLVIYARFDAGRLLGVASSLLVALGLTMHLAAVWDYAATANRQLTNVRHLASTVPPGRRLFQVETAQSLRFQADPLLHADGYIALWSHGVCLSNYEAAHYYFPIQFRPPYPQTLVTHLADLQSVNLTRKDTTAHVQEFATTDGQWIDVLLLRTSDQELISLAERTYGDVVLAHNGDLWALARRGAGSASP